jgi:hypothetical protein
MSQPKRFVLEFIDQNTNSLEDEVLFEVENVKLLCAQIGMDAESFDPAAYFELEDDDVVRIGRTFEIDVSTRKDKRRVCLRAAQGYDELSYKIHTNRELKLMLADRKPLAAFVENYPRDSEYEIIPEAAFGPYVTSGRLVKREKIYLNSDGANGRKPRHSFRRVLYAQIGEAWRIDAYLLLHETAEISGWNEGFERMEGTLLGYEQWQNDEYLKMVQARKAK